MIRSREDLVDFLDLRNKKRKHEIISLQSQLSKATGDLKVTCQRVAIVFSYAHWEGCVQDAAIAYLRYATFKTKPLQSYVFAFRALMLRNELQRAEVTKKRIRYHVEAIKLLQDPTTDSKRIDPERSIDTESNLTWEVFENICMSIGLESLDPWRTKGPFIDDLFRARCSIAHGQPFVPDDKLPKEALEFALWAINAFSGEVLNMAATDSFLEPVSGTR